MINLFGESCCTKGHEQRCKKSNSLHCNCECGGKNHGTENTRLRKVPGSISRGTQTQMPKVAKAKTKVLSKKEYVERYFFGQKGIWHRPASETKKARDIPAIILE